MSKSDSFNGQMDGFVVGIGGGMEAISLKDGSRFTVAPNTGAHAVIGPKTGRVYSLEGNLVDGEMRYFIVCADPDGKDKKTLCEASSVTEWLLVDHNEKNLYMPKYLGHAQRVDISSGQRHPVVPDEGERIRSSRAEWLDNEHIVAGVVREDGNTYLAKVCVTNGKMKWYDSAIPCTDFSLSPSKERIAFQTGGALQLYEFPSFKRLGNIKEELLPGEAVWNYGFCMISNQVVVLNRVSGRPLGRSTMYAVDIVSHDISVFRSGMALSSLRFASEDRGRHMLQVTHGVRGAPY
jgi:hypothetical protein